MKLRLILIFTACFIALFMVCQKNYEVAHRMHVAEISSSSLKNSTEVSPKELFSDTWMLIRSSYHDPELNLQNWNRWRSRYLKDIANDEDAYLAINSMLASLDDPYSKFLNAEEFKEQNTFIDSKIFGIGVNIISVAGKIFIANVIDDTPASAADLRQGDMISAIDDTPVKGMSVFEVSDYIKGKLNVVVELEILRDGKKIAKKIKREEIKVKTVEHKTLTKDISYIRISSFISQETPMEFIGALSEHKNSKALILDLRGNTGGLFQNAIFVANMFLVGGPIVNVVGREGDNSWYVADNSTYTYEKPLIILVDGESASASEIVSGALKDHERAVVVGTKTFGKGLVQKVFAMPNECGMNLTIAKYLTPRGIDINKKGIEPHYTVKLEKEDYLKRNDKQLKFAQSLAVQAINDSENLARR